MNILLVDDEPLALGLLEHTVAAVLPEAKRHSFQRAREAMEYARTERIDIAFLDIEMHMMSGSEMAKVLRGLYPRCNIIFCTGHPEYAVQAFELRASDFLLKPISCEQVRDAVQNLRYPIEEKLCAVTITCFGNFEACFHGEPIHFDYQRTREMLAYLVDRNGASVSTKELTSVLFHDEQHTAYFNRLRRDLLETFRNLGASEVIRQSKGMLGINRELVQCDYFDYVDGKLTAKPKEYMRPYEFGRARLEEIIR